VAGQPNASAQNSAQPKCSYPFSALLSSPSRRRHNRPPTALTHSAGTREVRPAQRFQSIAGNANVAGVSGARSERGDRPVRHRIVREIGSLAAALGGLDAIIFTAGVGENDAATRAEVADGCAWLELTLEAAGPRRAIRCAFRVQNALGQRLLQLIEQPVFGEDLLRVSAREKLVQCVFLDRHSPPPAVPLWPDTQDS